MSPFFQSENTTILNHNHHSDVRLQMRPRFTWGPLPQSAQAHHHLSVDPAKPFGVHPVLDGTSTQERPVQRFVKRKRSKRAPSIIDLTLSDEESVQPAGAATGIPVGQPSSQPPTQGNSHKAQRRIAKPTTVVSANTKSGMDPKPAGVTAPDEANAQPMRGATDMSVEGLSSPPPTQGNSDEAQHRVGKPTTVEPTDAKATSALNSDVLTASNDEQVKAEKAIADVVEAGGFAPAPTNGVSDNVQRRAGKVAKTKSGSPNDLLRAAMLLEHKSMTM